MRRSFDRFRGDDRGSVAVIFGLSSIVLCVSIGLAYDSSRLNNVTTRVQAALDAAALAAAKLMDQDGVSDTQIIDTARAFFDARRSEISMNGLVLGELQTTPHRSHSSVSVRVDGSLSSLVGQIANLQPTLDFSRQSQTVFKSRKVELSLVVDITGSMADLGKINSLKTAAKDVVDTLFASNPNPGAIRLSLVPYSASVNAGAYKHAVSGASSAIDSCVVERSGGPAGQTDATPSTGGYLGVSNTTLNPWYSCPAASVVPLTDLWNTTQRNAFKARIDALMPAGGTAGHIGLAWGWYFLSPKWASFWPPDQRPQPSSPDVIKAVILMTDGEFNMSYRANNMNSTDYFAADSAGAQTLALCDNMKKPGSDVTVFTIGFQAPANAEAMLRTCSGNDNFFDADDADDLIAAFREIAERLTTLRISG